MLSRLLAIIPAILAAVSFALSVVLLAAGNGPSTAPDFFWLSFNTTNLGGDLVQVTRDGGGNNSESGTGGGSELPLPGGGSLPIPGGPIGDLFGGIRGSLDSLLDDMINGITNGLGDLQSMILGNLTDSLGVRDNYRLYLSKICEGSLSDPNNPSSKFRLDRCIPYDNTRAGLRNITSSIPSSLSIGGITVSVPLVEVLTSTLNSVVSIAVYGSRALFALKIIPTVSMGIVMVASLAIIVLGNRRFLVRINLVSSMLGGITTFLFAVVMTTLIVAGRSVLAGLGGAVGLQTTQGGSFLAIGWIGAIFGMGAATYWFLVWFIDFRLSSFKRRPRTGEEIGNWRGILREVRSDLRLSRKA